MSLEQLQKLRTRRMEQRFVELQTQRRVVEAQEAQLHAQREQLAAFRQWRLDQQEALFAHLQAQPFTPQVLLDYQKKLAGLLEEEQRLQVQLMAAEQALEAAIGALAAAQRNANEATLKLEKIKEIIKLQDTGTHHAESGQ